MGLNGLDYTLLALAAAGLVFGYYRGFVAQMVSLAGFFIAYVIAFKFYKDFAPVLSKTIALPSYESYQKYEFVIKGLNLDTYIMNALAFAILFFGAKLTLTVLGRVLNVFAKVPGVNFLNRWSGALLGIAEAALLIIIAVNVMTILPSEAIQKLLSGSVTAPYLIKELPPWQESCKSFGSRVLLYKGRHNRRKAAAFYYKRSGQLYSLEWCYQPLLRMYFTAYRSQLTPVSGS